MISTDHIYKILRLRVIKSQILVNLVMYTFTYFGDPRYKWL